MKSKNIIGPVIPLPLSFNSNGSLDLIGFKTYVEFLFSSGINNVMTTVGTSRFNILDFEEVKSVNKIVAEQAQKHQSISIVANPLTGSTQHAIEFATHSKQIGADFFLLYFPERHYGDDNTYKFFNSVAESVDIPILIHEMPRRNGLGGGTVQYSLELLERLFEIDNIVGLKEEALDKDYSNAIVEKFNEKAIIIGAGGGMSRYLFRDFERGAASYLGGIGNFFPKVELDFFESIHSADKSLAEHIVNNIELPYFDAVVPFGWHPSLKVALSYKGLMQPYERAPMIQLPDNTAAEIKTAVDKIYTYA